MSLLRKICFFLLYCSTFWCFRAWGNPCTNSVRAGLDVGSGTTKMKVYHYRFCAGGPASIKEVSGPNCAGERKVSYGEDVESTGKIGEQTFRRGVNALKELKSLAVKCGAQDFMGVATSAFRRAKNGQSIAERLSRSAGIVVRVISREQEAILGFRGATLKLGLDSKICVWDIGGGSMQIICSPNGKKTVAYLGNVASVPFKNAIIKFQARQTSTPNPISQKDYRYALGITQKEAAKAVSALGDELQKSTVVGIGGVHFYAVGEALGKREYTARDIRAALAGKLSKTDRELGGGEYVDTAVSNLILVEGMMKHLQIASVKALKINLTEGLASSQDYWGDLSGATGSPGGERLMGLVLHNSL